MTTEVSTNTFPQEVEQAAHAVLLDFYAEWCAPCRMIAPVLAEIEKERSDIKVVKVNVDESPELAQRFGVMSIPTLVLFRAGKALETWVGVRPKPQLLKDLDTALNPQ